MLGFLGLIGGAVAGAIAWRWYARSQRRRLGLPESSAMSDRIRGLAIQLRNRASALDDRFGKKPHALSDFERADIKELDRIAGLRRYDIVRNAVALLDTGSDAMALRSTAADLDRFAATLRGSATPYHLTRSQLIVTAIGVAMLAGAGAFFMNTDVERGFLFYTGGALVAIAAIAAGIAFLMHTERN